MKWDLEERTEDALVAYLRGQCSGLMRVASAWELSEKQYPCADVFVGEAAPVSATADWNDARVLSVTVEVRTEGADEIDADGNVITTARERNALARSEVLNALFVSDLLARLNAQGVAAVAFSQAQFDNTARTNDGRYLVTSISGTVIAEPVAGS